MDNKLEDFLGDVISTEEKMKDLIKFIYSESKLYFF